jgi:arylsulfatase A-like enzyme
VDILPTILDYLDIPIAGACMGRSLKPVIEGRVKEVNEFVFVEYTGGAAADSYALRSNRYKYFRTAGSEPFAYDLADDPREQRKVFSGGFTQEIKVLERSLAELLKRQDNR